MSMLNSRKAFPDLFLEDMLPELSNIIMDKYSQQPDYLKQLFNYETTGKAIEQSTKVTGFPSAPEIPEGEDISYYEFKQGYDKTYVMTKYGLGFKTTEEMIDDGKFNIIAKLSRMIGKSIYETIQIRAFNVFNNGFATAGPDGVSLFNASHPLTGGGTLSNTASADLTVSSLQAAITAFETLTDDEGLHISVRPAILLVPSALKFTAMTILNSTLKSGTANNDMNALQPENLQIVSSPFLTDTGQWILLTSPDEHELHFYNRMTPKITGAYDFDSDSGKTKMKTRFDVGFSDWPGTYSGT